NRVEHDFAEIVVGPVAMEMRTGETEAPSAIRARRGPGDMRGFAAGDELAHGGVAFMRTVLAAGGVGCGYSRKDRSHVFHAVAEAHVKIPFVVELEGADAARDRMVGQLLEIRVPMRIHRPV